MGPFGVSRSASLKNLILSFDCLARRAWVGTPVLFKALKAFAEVNLLPLANWEVALHNLKALKGRKSKARNLGGRVDVRPCWAWFSFTGEVKCMLMVKSLTISVSVYVVVAAMTLYI